MILCEKSISLRQTLCFIFRDQKNSVFFIPSAWVVFMRPSHNALYSQFQLIKSCFDKSILGYIIFCIAQCIPKTERVREKMASFRSRSMAFTAVGNTKNLNAIYINLESKSFLDMIWSLLTTTKK